MTKTERVMRLGAWCGASVFTVTALIELAITARSASVDFGLIFGLGGVGFIAGVCAGAALFAIDAASCRDGQRWPNEIKFADHIHSRQDAA